MKCQDYNKNLEHEISINCVYWFRKPCFYMIVISNTGIYVTLSWTHTVYTLYFIKYSSLYIWHEHGWCVPFHRYTIYDLYTQNSFLTDLQLSICWETYQDCVVTVAILQNSFLPKRQCIGEFNFEDPCMWILCLLKLSCYSFENSMFTFN